MGIQRPDSTIISGQIKSNVPFRVCGHFVDKEPSRIMLGNDKASTIEDIKGRFLVKTNRYREIQSFYYVYTSYKPRRAVEIALKRKDIEMKKEASVIASNTKIEAVAKDARSKKFVFTLDDLEK